MKPLTKKQTYETTVEEYIKGEVLREVGDSLFVGRLLRFAPRPSDKSTREIPKSMSDWLVKRNALSWRQSARSVVTSNVRYR